MRRLALVAILASVVGVPWRGVAQAPPPRDTRRSAVQRVATLEDLQAKSAPERTLAARFDVPGEPVRPGMNDVPRSVVNVPRPEAPLGVKTPSEDELIASVLCFPEFSTAFGRVVSSRVVLNRSRTELFTAYMVEVSEWIRGKHEPTVVLGIRGGRVLVGGEEYATPIAAALQDSLRVGGSYVFTLLQVGPWAYRSSGTPVPVISNRLTLKNESEPAAQALERLRRISASCDSFGFWAK